MDGIEIERKFLIKMPGENLLSRLVGDEIEQTYLESEPGCAERVRARTHGGVTTYTHTAKRRINSVSSHEDECEIDEAEYRALLERREHGTETIQKTRYLLPYRGFVFEIDVYPAWRGVAVMEVELPREDAEFGLPQEITVIKEVSGKRKFSNHSLSRGFPREDELPLQE